MVNRFVTIIFFQWSVSGKPFIIVEQALGMQPSSMFRGAAPSYDIILKRFSNKESKTSKIERKSFRTNAPHDLTTFLSK